MSSSGGTGVGAAQRGRSWDHRRRRGGAGGGGPPLSKKQRPGAVPVMAQQQQQQRDAVPFITVQGKRYYSDRFYLNRSIYDDDDDDDDSDTSDDDDDDDDDEVGTSGAATRKRRIRCTCGAENPPPLLDRSQLVASLQLKAAILATYTVNPSYLIQHEFPSLLGPQSTVPTLVLHGQKGWNPNNNKKNTKHINSKHRHGDDDSDDDDTTDDYNSMDDNEDFIMDHAPRQNDDDRPAEFSNMPPQPPPPPPGPPAQLLPHQPEETKCNKNDDDDSIVDDDGDDNFSWATQPEETAPRYDAHQANKNYLQSIRLKNAAAAAAPPPPPPPSVETVDFISTLPKTTAAATAVSQQQQPTEKAAATTATMHHANSPYSNNESKKKRPYHRSQQQQQQQQQQHPISTTSSSCPSHVHWTEVLPCWMPLQELPFLQQQQQQQNDANNSNNNNTTSFSVSDAIAKRRKSKRGVHHPKFMILFETSGSIVVVVSTANLTRQQTTDASWLQRFYPIKSSNTVENHNNNNNNNNNTTTSSSSAVLQPINDFGFTLAHLLQCQTWATRQGDWTPAAFCQKYLGFDNINTQQDSKAAASSASCSSSPSSFSNAFRNLYKGFDFSTAQVHLVSHVPGDYPMMPSSVSTTGNASNNGINNASDQYYNPSCFGRMRVAEILQRLSPCQDGGGGGGGGAQNNSSRPWLNKCIVSSNDQLILQPTSFGADWTPPNMADVTRSYLESSLSPFQDNEDQESTPTVSDWLQRTDIVWPTDDFMQAVSANLQANSRRRREGLSDDADNEDDIEQDVDGDEEDERISPTSAMTMGFTPRLLKAQATVDTSGDNDNNEDEGDQDCGGDDDFMVAGNVTRDNDGFVFLSCATFNKIHMDCLSRMVMFEPSYPPPRKATLAPHFKSIARHYRGQDHRLIKDYAMGKSRDNFSWFLLTSACLSLGAQGERSSTSRKKSSSTTSLSGETISFSNFELGVLFVSRLQGRPQSDRLYCWKPDRCTCAQDCKLGAPSKLIHLPVPFSFCPNRYQDNPDEMTFCETPYFNEIPAGTAGVGNMMYTPLGAQEADRLDRQG